jgi:hypothetical protein
MAEPRPLVASSWRRCAGADAGRPPPVRMSGDALLTYRAQHPLWTIRPVLDDVLDDVARDSDEVYALADAGGMLLSVQGDPAAVRRAERMHFVEGAGWSERDAGTNAPGTALATATPVRIDTVEHLNPLAHPWSCVAAPIRDPDTGRVLGVVDLTSREQLTGPHALALVRAAARAAEEALARRMAGRDLDARAAFGGAGGSTALVSPGGRLLGAGTGFAEAGLRRVELEPAGVDGYLVVRFVETDGPPDGPRLAALGRDSAGLELDGRMLRLSPRHSELLVLLALSKGGMSAGRLAVELSEEELHPVTIRAEMSRLRHVVGEDLLGSHPYRLLRPIRSDFLVVRDLLAEGRVEEALALYNGPLLPNSESPAVCDHRDALEQQVRGAVLGSGDPTLLRRWVDAPWGAEDGPAWHLLARQLPGGSAQRAAAALRARSLQDAMAGSVRLRLTGPPKAPSATLLQPCRS